MESAFPADAGVGVYRQEVIQQPVSRRWWLSFTFLHVALLTPYASKLITFYYAEGVFPIRPVFYMIGFGMLSLVWVVGKRPDFTKTGILLLVLLVFRMVDVGLLQRFILPGGNSLMFSSLGAVFFMGVVLQSSAGVLHKMSYKPVLIVSISTIGVVVASIFYEMMGFAKFTNVDGRPSGQIGDPNNACIVMILMLGVFLSVSERFWHNIGAIALTTVGVFPTLSRSGMLVLLMIIFAYVILNFNRYFARFIALGVAAVPLVAIGVGFLISNAKEASGKKDDNAVSRIEGIFKGESTKLGSSDRMQDLNDGLRAIQERPVFGFGTGAGTEWYQPHNQILTLWIDLGLAGAVIYSAILLILVWKSIMSGFKGVYAVIPIVLFVPFSQALVDNFAYLYAIAIVLVVTSRQFWALRISRPTNPEIPQSTNYA